MKTVLALGGGGIKGLVTAMFVASIPNLKPDLIVGTSTGGILALALAIGKPREELANLYRKHGSTIFRRRHRLSGVLRAKYSNAGLGRALRTEFGNAAVGDCPTPVMVVCQWKSNNTLSLIRSWRGSWMSMSMVDAGLCTSAAPTYFPAHMGRIDGGVARNNPASVAMVEALKQYAGEPFRLLSITCPRTLSGSDPTSEDWGVIPWVQHGLIESFMDSGMDACAYETSIVMRTLGYPYLHVEPVDRLSVDMDDASPRGIAKLTDIAGRLIESKISSATRFLNEAASEGSEVR